MSATTTPMPPLRYGHTQTLINDKTIVILGGFDSLSGEAVSLADIWLYDIDTNQWSHLEAKLDKDNKPASRSSHSQVLMPDGISILMQVLISCDEDFLLTLRFYSYGGYDGYHVYNDVAVLDTRTWTWTIKNTNAAVQGRADVSISLISFPTKRERERKRCKHDLLMVHSIQVIASSRYEDIMWMAE